MNQRTPTGKIALLASSFCHSRFPVLEGFSVNIAITLGETS